jgi:tRNA-specific 2-thiouridylase
MVECKNVVVAMSGGVDSSVAAALMVENGYNVTGLMLKLWTSECDHEANACCTPESISLAREVATQLGFPFYVIDTKEVFKQVVVDHFIQASQQGRTPNPCYLCNQKIRWGFLLDKATTLGADFLVTGHYGQIKKDTENHFHLFKANDPKKDQSYVLSGLNQEQLSKTLFPLGKYLKSEVRDLADSYSLRVARKPDSQDLCFVGSHGYRSFLNSIGSETAINGLIRNQDGVVLGEHTGLTNFTIGQRKGILSGFKDPLYVLKKDMDKNELIVGGSDLLNFTGITFSEANWIAGTVPDLNQNFDIKVRYKANPVNVRIVEIDAKSFRADFEYPIRDATPGQIAVIYLNNEVIGSGIIETVLCEGI